MTENRQRSKNYPGKVIHNAKPLIINTLCQAGSTYRAIVWKNNALQVGQNFNINTRCDYNNKRTD